MIKPTIGRVVWFWQNSTQSQPFTGLVCYVHNDTTLVNLAVFDANGTSRSETSVFLYPGEGVRPEYRFAEWMPYQRGQAAKTEQIERQLKVVEGTEIA